MKKETLNFNKEYFEKKIKELSEQQQKVANILNQYTDLFKKLEGAIELTQGMLKELEPQEEEIKT